jgi:hypothetical protein
MTVLVLLLFGASWPQKLRAVEKQALGLQEHGRALLDLASESTIEGRPVALAALRSEVEALGGSVNRLDAKVRALRAD